MSEHKTGKKSNPSFDKELYWSRRKRGLTGTPPPIIVNRPVIDDDGNLQRIPLGNKVGRSGHLALQRSGKAVDRRFTKPNWGDFVRRKTVYVSKVGAGE